jgi:hypothetical protein
MTDIDAPTPASVPAREGEKVGKDGKLYLPVPHPLIENPEDGSTGAKVNSAWRGANYFFRGLYGTFVEWGVSWMDLALEYPKVVLMFLVCAGVAAEETLNEHPLLSGSFQYVMYSLDPDAAEIIFPPETDVSEAQEVIDKMAAEILTNSAEEYYSSVEYKALELQVRTQMHAEVRESLYKMSGMESLAPVAAPPAPAPEKAEAPVETPMETEEP